MSRRRLWSMVAVSSLTCAVSTTARADPNSKSSEERLGWAILGLSMAAGGALMSASLAVDCPQDDGYECARWTSLGLWGGIGIASAGAAAGLIIVKAASRPAPVRISFTVDRPQSAPSMPRVTLVCVF